MILSLESEKMNLLSLYGCSRKKQVQKRAKVMRIFRFCCTLVIAAEQKARAVYDNILRLSDDPDVNEVIKFLRQREVTHFQRFGEALDRLQAELKHKHVKGIGIKER